MRFKKVYNESSFNKTGRKDMNTFLKYIDVEELDLRNLLKLDVDVVQVLLKIEYKRSKYYPATLTTPEEPVELTVEEVEIEEIFNVEGNCIPLEEEQRKKVYAKMLEDIKGLEAEIETWCWEDSEEEIDYDILY